MNFKIRHSVEFSRTEPTEEIVHVVEFRLWGLIAEVANDDLWDHVVQFSVEAIIANSVRLKLKINPRLR